MQPTRTNNPSRALSSRSEAQFGKPRLVDFMSDPTYVNVNHGSYGYVPKQVLAAKHQLEMQCQFNTEKWFRRDAEKLLNETRALVANKVNCPVDNLFMVQNATDAINCLTKSLVWAPGDVILLSNLAYASIRKTIYVLRDRYGISILQLDFTLQDLQSPESIQLRVQDFVNSYPKKIKLAILDHISSVPSIVLPIDTLSEFFNEKRIPLFVDGAHAYGQVHVDLAEIQPAAYFSNFHKWSFAPKSAAFLYISDQFVNIVRPVITGNFMGEGPAREFFWTGTRDYTSYLSVPKAIQYHESFGLNAVMYHNHNLALAGARQAAKVWGTRLFSEDERVVGSLCTVQVPCDSPELAGSISMTMMDQDNCFLAMLSFQGKVYCRFSAQIYNEVSDYDFAARRFLQRLKAATK